MEEGSLRADANVSINLPGKGLGKKVEIKNLNSSRFVRLGLNYEIKRQGGILDGGGDVIQETRLWNENRDETLPMRQKENAQDYRYFPEPDIPVFCPGDAFLKSVEEALVELPRERTGRFMEEYGLGKEQADLICDERQGADYFEEAVLEAFQQGLDKKDAASRIANWFLSELKHILNRDGVSLSQLPSFRLNPRRLASLVVMLSGGRLSGKLAKRTAELVIEEDRDPAVIVAEKGWELLADPEKIAEFVKSALAAEAHTLSELREAEAAGNTKRRASLAAYLVGRILAATGGRADPKIAGEQLELELGTQTQSIVSVMKT
jgi:aspartyl-tRNA(Asn)/glutamyl-tRNA(Gln) amidotransferase subunit B